MGLLAVSVVELERVHQGSREIVDLDGHFAEHVLEGERHGAFVGVGEDVGLAGGRVLIDIVVATVDPQRLGVFAAGAEASASGVGSELDGVKLEGVDVEQALVAVVVGHQIPFVERLLYPKDISRRQIRRFYTLFP